MFLKFMRFQNVYRSEIKYIILLNLPLQLQYSVMAGYWHRSYMLMHMIRKTI